MSLPRLPSAVVRCVGLVQSERGDRSSGIIDARLLLL